jgi:hypothetical protein
LTSPFKSIEASFLPFFFLRSKRQTSWLTYIIGRVYFNGKIIQKTEPLETCLMKDKEFKIKDYQNITIDFQNCNFLSKILKLIEIVFYL